MIGRSRLRHLLAVSACATTALGGLVFTTPAASAASNGNTVRPMASNRCGGDVCAGGNEAVDSVTFTVWAYNTSFNGYFKVTAPDGKVWRSPTRLWPAGGTHYTLTTNIQNGVWSFDGIQVDMGVNVGSVGFVTIE